MKLFAKISITYKSTEVLAIEQLYTNTSDKVGLLLCILRVAANFPHSTKICFTVKFFLDLPHSGGFACLRIGYWWVMLAFPILGHGKTRLSVLFLLWEESQFWMLCLISFSFLPSRYRESHLFCHCSCTYIDLPFHVVMGYCSAEYWVVLFCISIWFSFPKVPICLGTQQMLILRVFAWAWWITALTSLAIAVTTTPFSRASKVFQESEKTVVSIFPIACWLNQFPTNLNKVRDLQSLYSKSFGVLPKGVAHANCSYFSWLATCQHVSFPDYSLLTYYIFTLLQFSLTAQDLSNLIPFLGLINGFGFSACFWTSLLDLQ